MKRFLLLAFMMMSVTNFVCGSAISGKKKSNPKDSNFIDFFCAIVYGDDSSVKVQENKRIKGVTFESGFGTNPLSKRLEGPGDRSRDNEFGVRCDTPLQVFYPQKKSSK